MAGPTIEEVNYFKGISTHPDSISVGSATFRNILNGWIIRDGIIDMRPGFDVDSTTPRVPGLALVPGTNQYSFAGIKTLATNTFVENDGRMFWFEPNSIANSGMVGISAGDSLNLNGMYSVAVNASYVAIGNGAGGANVITVFSRITGEVIATVRSGGSFASADGVAWDPITGELWWADFTNNQVFSGTISNGTLSVTNTIGNGTAGLTTGSPLSTRHLTKPTGLAISNDGVTRHVYIVGQHYVYDANITTNTGSLIAGGLVAGYANGTGAAATFDHPQSLGFFISDPTNLYVADENNNAIRLVTTAGTVTTFAGSLTGTAGHANGVGTAATFKNPIGLICISAAVDNPTYTGLRLNTIFVSDFGNTTIRNINEFDATVGALCGQVATPLSISGIDGTTAVATFAAPAGLAFDLDRNLGRVDVPAAVQIFVMDITTGSNPSALRVIDAQEPVVDNNGSFGVGGGNNNLVLSTFAGGDPALAGITPTVFQQKLGYAGGIYNYNNTIPTVTASPGTTYNGVMRFFEYDGTTYFNSARGVMAMDIPATYTNAQIAHYAGAPQGYDLILTLVPAGAGTLLLADHAAAYRIVWGYRTASGRPIQGAPSSRFEITNPSGAGNTKNVQIVSQIPIGATTSWVYQLYRTETVNTVGSTVDPGDTMFLVYEANLTSADLGNGTVTITDATPDAALGEDLYTNATQQTESQSNDQPPICLDMCLFGEENMAIYANTINKQNMFVNLVGVTGFSGAPTITFTFADGQNNFTITGNSTTASDGIFVYSTGGTAAANIDATARSIVLTINQYTLNRRLRAFYVSPYDGTPGQIAIQENFIGSPSWAITATSGISPMFAPIIPTSGTSYQAVPDVSPNGLYCAKIQNPDAVPLVNKFLVGDSSESIRRVFALRESVMIIKERSIWRGTGNTPDSFSITLLDNTVSIRADESCAILNNEVYAMTTQGVVAISDNGVRIVARPIEYQLDQIYGTLAAPLDLNGLVTANGSEDYRTYFLSSFKTTSNFTWAYNVFTNAWTRWDLILQGITVRNGRLIGAVLPPLSSTTFQVNTPQIIQQLNMELFENPNAYHDGGGLCIVSALNTSTKVISINYDASFGSGYGQWQFPIIAAPTVGWIIGQGIITADDGTGNLTISDTTGLVLHSAATVLRPINYTMTSNPHGGGASFKLKQWGDFFVCLENQNLFKYSTGFSTNAQSTTIAFKTQEKTVNQTNSTPTSAPYFKEQVMKVTVPKAVASGNLLQWQFTVNQANALVALKAIGIETRGIDSAKGQQ